MHIGRRDFGYQTTYHETEAEAAGAAGLLEYSGIVGQAFHCHLAVGLEIHEVLKLYPCWSPDNTDLIHKKPQNPYCSPMCCGDFLN